LTIPRTWQRSSTPICGETRPGQDAYRGALYQRFAISQTSFAKGVVTQALELAGMWLNDTDLRLAAIQASIVTSMLAAAPDR